MAHESSSSPKTAWHGAGTRLACLAGEVFVRTEGDLHAATPVLLLHGFPTSSHDFVKVWPRLAKKHPLITLDFLGFGMSDKPESFGYGLFEQADVVLEVLKKLNVARAHIVAHDMGTSVATELCARRERGFLPIEIASLTLTNGSVFIELAHLAPAQHLLRTPKLGSVFARFASYPLFRRSMRRLFAEPDSVEESELREMWELMSRDDGNARMAKIISYVDQRHQYGQRWTSALSRLDVPSLVLWGAKDPVAVLAIGERLGKTIPGTRLRVLSDLGHYPHVEGPDAFSRELTAFLAES